MVKIQTEILIDAPLGVVYEYYTNPGYIKQSWPSDFIKESESISGQSSEEGAEMIVEGRYLGKKKR